MRPRWRFDATVLCVSPDPLSGCFESQVRFASCVGYPVEKDPDRDYYIGADAMQKRAALALKWPVVEGVVSFALGLNELCEGPFRRFAGRS